MLKPVVCCANCEYVFPECGAKNMGCDKFSPNWRNRPAPDKTGKEARPTVRAKRPVQQAKHAIDYGEGHCPRCGYYLKAGS